MLLALLASDLPLNFQNTVASQLSQNLSPSRLWSAVINPFYFVFLPCLGREWLMRKFCFGVQRSWAGDHLPSLKFNPYPLCPIAMNDLGSYLGGSRVCLTACQGPLRQALPNLSVPTPSHRICLRHGKVADSCKGFHQSRSADTMSFVLSEKEQMGNSGF